LFERDITPTRNIAAGIVRIPPGHEQQHQSLHEIEEEIYFIVKGRARFLLGERWVDVEKDTAVYVAPKVAHRAINTGNEELEMYCVSAPSVYGRVGGYVDFVKGWKQIR
jgi:mannose-6-phosphate isomerase-like protein (cupin superfamily)